MASALLSARLALLSAPSFFGVSTLLCLLPLPGLSGAVNVVSGVVFGTSGGAILFASSATLAGVGALLVARSALRAPVARATARWRPAFRALDAAVEKDGFNIILLLRLSPLVPFAVASLLLALTPVPLGTYTAATLLGALLGAVPFAYAGHAGGLLARAGADAATSAGGGGSSLDAVQLFMTLFGLAATVLVTVKVSAVVREALTTAAARHSGGTLDAAEEGVAGDGVGTGAGGSALGAHGGSGGAVSLGAGGHGAQRPAARPSPLSLDVLTSMAPPPPAPASSRRLSAPSATLW